MEDIIKFCDQLKEDYRRVKRFYQIAVAVFGVLVVVSFGNNMVLQHMVKDQGKHIEIIRKNYVSYEHFMMFNRTYELQLEETQAILNGDEDKLQEIHNKYRELRSMIITQRIIRSAQ